MTMLDVPPPPPGFSLESDAPPPPEGFVLEGSATPETRAPYELPPELRPATPEFVSPDGTAAIANGVLYRKAAPRHLVATGKGEGTGMLDRMTQFQPQGLTDRITIQGGLQGDWEPIGALPGYKLMPSQRNQGEGQPFGKEMRPVRDLMNPQWRAARTAEDPDLDKKLQFEYRQAFGDGAQGILRLHLKMRGIEDPTPAQKMKLVNDMLAQNVRAESEALAKDVGGGAAAEPRTEAGQALMAQAAQQSPQGMGEAALNAMAQPATAILAPILPGGQYPREALAGAAHTQHPYISAAASAAGTFIEPTTALFTLATAGAGKAALPVLAAKFEGMGLSKVAAAALAQRVTSTVGMGAMATQMAETGALGSTGELASAGEVAKMNTLFAAMPIAGHLTGQMLMQAPGAAKAFAAIEKASPVLSSVGAGVAKGVAGMVEANTMARLMEGRPTTLDDVYNDAVMALVGHMAGGGVYGDMERGQQVKDRQQAQAALEEMVQNRNSTITAIAGKLGMQPTDELVRGINRGLRQQTEETRANQERMRSQGAEEDVRTLEEKMRDERFGTYTDEHLQAMSTDQLRQAAADAGVPFDTASTTIPRILDAVNRRQTALRTQANERKYAKMSNKELYDEAQRIIRENGIPRVKAGNREQNIQILRMWDESETPETPISGVEGKSDQTAAPPPASVEPGKEGEAVAASPEPNPPEGVTEPDIQRWMAKEAEDHKTVNPPLTPEQLRGVVLSELSKDPNFYTKEEKKNAPESTPVPPQRPKVVAAPDAAPGGKGADTVAGDEFLIPEKTLQGFGEDLAASAGVTFDGVQSGGGKTGDRLTFTDPETKTTFMLKVEDSDPETLAKKIAAVREKFAKAKTPAPEAIPDEEEVGKPDSLTYEEFSAQYRDAFRNAMKYKPNEAGAQVFTEKMAKLADAHPDWAEKVEAEETPSAKPKVVFKEGDRVQRVRGSELLTGTIKTVEPNGDVVVDVDQINAPGGVPIKRKEFWANGYFSELKDSTTPKTGQPDTIKTEVSDDSGTGRTDRSGQDKPTAPPVLPGPPVPSGGAGPGSPPKSSGGRKPGRASSASGSKGARGGTSDDGKEGPGGPGEGNGDESSRGGSGGDKQPPAPENKPDAEPSKDVAPKSVLAEADKNYRTPAGELAPVGQIGKIRANTKAITLLKTLEAENRNPTPEEKAALAQYTGWGHSKELFNDSMAEAWEAHQKGEYSWEWNHYQDQVENWAEKYYEHYKALKSALSEEEWRAASASSLFAHYTSREVIEGGLWEAIRKLGFKGGRILENSAGIGHVLGLMPEDIANASRLTAVELDPLTGRMLAKLYPQATVHVMGFEEAKIKRNSVDLTVGNFPFNQTGWASKEYPFSLHNQFFARSLDLTKPGGLIVAITSNSTMDNPASLAFRKWMTERADLVAAIRLPNTAFKKNAGTEVTTDILIFRKKTTGLSPVTNAFIATPEMEVAGGEKTRVNQYFHDHPEMMLGKMSLTGSMYGGDKEPTLDPIPGAKLADQLKEAVSRIPADIAGKASFAPEETGIKAEAGAHEASYVVKDGKVHQIQGGELMRPSWSNAKEKQAKDLIGVRDKAQELFSLQLSPDATDEQIAAATKELKKLYEEYVKKNGRINEQSSDYLSDDPLFPAGLEVAKTEWEERKIKGGLTVKRPVVKYYPADIFEKRTLYPRVEPKQSDSVVDAVSVSLSWRNNVDVDFVASLTGLSPEEAKTQMVARGVAFENPDTGILESRDEYLSGNVKEKLQRAKDMAVEDKSFEANVKALEEVQPKDVSIADWNEKTNAYTLQFRLGTNWIPAEVYRAWAENLFNNSRALSIRYARETGSWLIEWDRSLQWDEANTTTYAAVFNQGSKTAVELIEDAINLRDTTVTHTWRDADGTTHTEVLRDETNAARAQQEVLRQMFEDWVRKSPYAKTVEKVYNDTLNTNVLRKFTPPTFKNYPNANAKIELRPHQKASVARAMIESYIMAHPVGTGKTYAFITTAMEWKRLGMARKPMISVLKSTLPQIVASFKDLYPTAKILYPEKGEFTPKNRQAFLKRIATGDWDVVIATHENMVGIQDNPAQIRRFIQERIDELIAIRTEEAQASGRRSPRIRDLENAIRKLQRRLDALNQRATDDIGMTFDQLGVDGLIVDEAHKFKKLEFSTRMGNVKGLDKGASLRGMSLFLKIRHIQGLTDGKNVILSTGTPVTNTLAEVWNMMRYVRPDVLRNFGIEQFDEFASSFTRTTTESEQTNTGGWKRETRFSKFTNPRELSTIFRTTADVLDPEQLAIPKPALKNGEPTVITIPRGERIASYMQYLIERYEAFDRLTGQARKDMSHEPIVINTLARKAALDMRLIDPQAPEDPKGKVAVAVQEVFRRWKEHKDSRLTQAIFSDLMASPDGSEWDINEPLPEGFRWETDADGNMVVVNARGQIAKKNPVPDSKRFFLFKEIKRKLVELGVPADEIAIINDANSDEKRAMMMEAVNKGEIRVIMGSTDKLGTGVNIQSLLVAIHELDCPYRPADMEQREGRILRQGNLCLELGLDVEIVRYGVAQTFDASAYDRLARKQRFINDVLTGAETSGMIDDPGGDALASFQEAYADITGDPLLKEKFDVEAKVKGLERQQRSHEQKAIERAHRLLDAKASLPDQKRRLEEFKTAIPELQKQFAKYEDIGVTGLGVGREVGAEAAKLLEAHLKKGMEDVKEAFKDSFFATARTSGMHPVEINGIPVRLEAYIYADKDGKPMAGSVEVHYVFKIPGTDHIETGTVRTGRGLMESVQARIQNGDALLKAASERVLQTEKNIKELSTPQAPFDKAEELAAARKRFNELDRHFRRLSGEIKEEKLTGMPEAEGWKDLTAKRDVANAWAQARESGKAALRELRNAITGQRGGYLMSGPIPQKLAETVVQFAVDVVKALAKSGQHGFENFIRWVAHNADPLVRDEIMGRAAKYYNAAREHADTMAAGAHTSMTPEAMLPPAGIKGYRTVREIAKQAPTGDTPELRKLARKAPENVPLELVKKLRAKAEEELAKLKDAADVGQAVRQQIAGYAKELPREMRGDFLTRVANAKKPADLLKAFDLMDTKLENAEHRDAVQRVKDLVAGADPMHMAPHFKAAFMEVMKGVDLHSPTARTERAAEGLKKHLDALPEKERNELLATLPERATALLDRMAKTPLSEMTLDELKDLGDSIASIIHQNAIKKQLLAAKKLRAVDEAVEAIKEEVKDLHSPLGATPGTEKTVAKAKRQGRWLWRAVQYLSSPEVVMQAAGGEDSTVHQVFYETLREGENRTTALWRQYDNQIRAVFAKHEMRDATILGDKSKTLVDWFKSPRKVRIGGQAIDMTGPELLSVYLYSVNPDARSKMMENGILPDRFRGESDKIVRPTAPELESIARQLTPFEKDLATTFIKINVEMGQAIKKEFVKLFGYEPIIEKNYFPLKPDSSFREALIDEVSASAPTMTLRWLEQGGPLKPRVKHSVPLLIPNALKAQLESLRFGTAFVGKALPARDARILLNSAELREVTRGRLAAKFDRALLRYLSDWSSGRVRELGPLEEMWRRAGRAMAVGKLAFRPTSAAMNFFGAPLGFMTQMSTREAAAYAGRWVKSAGSLLFARSYFRDNIEPFNSFLAERYDPGGELHRLGASVEGSSFGGTGIPEAETQLGQKFRNLQNVSMAPMQAGEMRAVVSMHKTLRALYPEMSNEAIGERLEMAVRRTQNSVSELDTSEALRDARRNPLLGMVFMFTNQATKMRDVVVRDALRARREKTPEAYARLARTTALMTLSATALTMGVRAAWRAVRKGFQEDKKETTAISLALDALGNLGEVVHPWVGDAIGMFQGFTPQSLVGENMERLTNAIKNIQNIDKADSGELPRAYRIIRDLGKVIFELTGTPLEVPLEAAEGAYRMANPPRRRRKSRSSGDLPGGWK